ncbi:unnamed protein product [Penicillium nalgiovense]|nr:unnamed protein product [Penicillium nalgiovense]CAG8090700.1 unnamed protein product [Penicillium nalgiovense]CAG8127513.1 unnamed protein product [Penicillium nalgiovense]CAG8130183.1 unnamed protein product [Penicillium nalgiovense]CAG8130608.1 unnamed protein product [Penicillium nalgiovense]
MNGGVYEPLAVRIPRSYPITTVQFLVTGGSVVRLWGSEVARCIRRGFFEVTAGDCDELDTTSYQHDMNGDCIAEDYWGTVMFPLLESKRASALSARAPRYRCDPMLYHPDMTIGGIDDEPMLISVPATNREDKAVYTETHLSQLKSQKYRPKLSHLVLRVAQAFDIYKRAEMNQAEIYGAESSRSQKCLLGTGAW